jgi:beta-lactam-binding protein with PASTA domain
VLDAPPPAVSRPRQPVVERDERGEHDRRRISRNRRRGWLALLVVLLLTAVAAVAGWYYTDGRFTTAPALTTMTESQAESAAREAGLNVVFAPAYSESVRKGVVITTTPGPGEKVVHGTQIEAVLSSGPERYRMPKVVGLASTAVRAALTRNNLAVGTTRNDYSETVPAGVVLKASQPAGASLRKATPVDLTVSAGPRPIRIRSHENSSAKAAAAALKKSGFRVRVTTAHSSKVPAGQVIRQVPDHGSGHAGDQIALTRSLGPVLVTVPNVRSMGVKAATQVMRSAGFRVEVRPVRVNYLGIGYVSYSKPGASGQAPKGSTITLYAV